MNKAYFRALPNRAKICVLIAVAAGINCASLADASQHPHAESPSAGHGHDATADSHDVDSNGIKLGDFRIRSYHAVESQKSSVKFTLYATVAEDKRPTSLHLLADRKQKVRDQVIVATRLVPLHDFNEADLASFRRRLVVQLRRALPELAIDNVYVSDFELKLDRM
jgi:hypothetical protein